MKQLTAILLALALCFSLVACGGAGGQASDKAPDFASFTYEDWSNYADKLEKSGEAKYRILYIVSWAASEYFINSYEVWKDIFAERGWELEMQGPKEYTAESELSVLETALTSQRYDAIILYPIGTDWVANAYENLWELYHTPIIISGYSQSTKSGSYYLFSDNWYISNGDYMVQMITDYVDANKDYFSKYDGEGIPIVFAGQSYNPEVNTRITHAMEKLEADGRFKTLMYYESVYDAYAIDYMEGLIQNYPETEIILAYNDVLTVGFNTALQASSEHMSDHLKMFGADGITAALQLMVEQGDSSVIGGSIMSNHWFMAELLEDIIRIGVPAAKQGMVVDEVNVRAEKTFREGPSGIVVTPANAQEILDKLNTALQ